MPDSERYASHFDEEEEFVGELRVGGDLISTDTSCSVVMNPLRGAPKRSKIRGENITVNPERHIGDELPGFRHVAESKSSGRRQLLEGHLRSYPILPGGSSVKIGIDRAFRYREIDFGDEIEEGRVFRNWVLPDLSNIGDPFKPDRHSQRGVVFGYRPEGFRNWKEGEWVDQGMNMVIKGKDYEVRPRVYNQEIETDEGSVYIAIPRLILRREYELKGKSPRFEDHVAKVKNEKSIDPFLLALRFVTARRIQVQHESLVSEHAETGVQTRLMAYRSVTDRESSPPNRSPMFKKHWDLIKDLTEAISRQDSRSLKRVRRAIGRYVEAFEAPYLEMRLVALHSALTILVKDRRMDVEPDPDFPSQAGRLLTPLKKFLTIKGVEWKDLIPEGMEKGDFFRFNKLRNEYMKDFEHNVESYEDIRISQKLFERGVLAHLGIERNKHDVMQRWL